MASLSAKELREKLRDYPQIRKEIMKNRAKLKGILDETIFEDTAILDSIAQNIDEGVTLVDILNKGIDVLPITKKPKKKIVRKKIALKSVKLTLYIDSEYRLNTKRYSARRLNSIFTDHTVICLVDIKGCQGLIYPVELQVYKGTTNGEMLALLARVVQETVNEGLVCGNTKKSYVLNIERQENRLVYIMLG